MNELMDNHRKTWDKEHLSESGYGGYSKFNERRLHWVLNLLPSGFLNKQTTILEIGCGSGNWIKAVAPMVKMIHGVDISLPALQIAEKQLADVKNISLTQCDGATLKTFGDKTIDLVYSFWTFQHIPRAVTESYLKEAYRVLKDDGLLLFQVESYDNHKLNEGDISFLKGKTEQVGYTRQALSEITSRNGFIIIKKDQEDFRKWKRVYLWSVCKKKVK